VESGAFSDVREPEGAAGGGGGTGGSGVEVISS